MNNGWLVLLLITGSVASAETREFGVSDKRFTVEFVEVGNAGNPPDFSSSTIGIGAVDYGFQIGKHEVSRDMIGKANESSIVDGADVPLDLRMEPGTDFFTSFTPQHPATALSGTQIMRFVNWLNTSEGYHPAYSFDVVSLGEFGITRTIVVPWSEDNFGYDPSNVVRHRGARFVLPTNDEWYKAAYHDASSGAAGVYFDFATGSNGEPTRVPSGVEAGTAVYDQPKSQGPAFTTEAGGLSPYGTMGQHGNVWEMQEPFLASPGDIHQVTQGSAYPDPFLTKQRSLAGSGGAESVGFRIAMLPDVEPLPVGDFGMNARLSADDIDLLSQQVVAEINTPRFDLNSDGVVNSADRTFWIEELADTSFGDADLNGTVEFADFLQLSANFNQETGWAGGDFDGNGVAEFADFLLLSDNFGKTGSGTAAVPEPSAGLLLVGVLIGISSVRRSRVTA